MFDMISIGGEDFPLVQGFENFQEQLLRFFPNEKEALKHYIETLQKISSSFPLYNLQIPGNHNEMDYRSQSAFDFFTNISNKQLASRQKPEARSQKPTLSSILSGNNFLYDGQKDFTPLHIPALINHSFISSSWRPRNGSGQIASALVNNLEAMGGRLYSSTSVHSVIKEGERFTVSSLNGEKFISSKVIAATHPNIALSFLDQGELRKVYTDRIRNLPNTNGAFSVYIVPKPETFKYLDYNVYYHKEMDVWKDVDSDRWPSSYLLITPDPDKSAIFAKSLVLMTRMPGAMTEKWNDSITGKRDSSYYAFKKEMADRLLDLAEIKFPGLRNCIGFMETSTPLTWRDYTGTPGGAMYGIRKDYNSPLKSEILPRTRIPGFLLTGQSVNLHGMMGVTTGAVLTCCEILGAKYLINQIQHG
ncbi:MAG: FAD-dependent oxidoreductase [Bacteroidota bacterium]